MNTRNNEQHEAAIKQNAAKNVNSVRNQTESSGVRFASDDSVKAASSWAIGKYAKTFQKLAQ